VGTSNTVELLWPSALSHPKEYRVLRGHRHPFNVEARLKMLQILNMDNLYMLISTFILNVAA
jgi:hypothetical protein